MSQPESLSTALAGAYHQEKLRPDAVFLTQPIGGGQVRDTTFRQALDEARRMAAHLRSLDLPEQSQIAIIGKNSAHWILAELAIWMAGHVSVPLFPTLTSDTAQLILDHSESRLVFVGKLDVWDELRKGVPAGMPRIALPLSPDDEAEPWEAIVARTSPIEGHPDRDPDELATIIYTSGTTGIPKGVMHSFRSMVEPVHGLAKVVGVSPEDRILSYLPLSHVFERFCGEFPALLYGARLYFAESLDTFAEDLRRARPTLFISVPRLWLKFQHGVFAKVPPEKLERLLHIPIVSYFVRKKVLKGLGLDACRFAGSGSAPISNELLEWYRGLGLELLEGYGLSENFCYSHISAPGRGRAGYVGEPYPEVECRISETGEIEVKSPGNMLGYFKAPEKTAEAMTEDGFLRTGDLGEIDELGRLKITGRTKDLFKTSKGKYVAPAPIETRLLSRGPLEQVCVSGSGMPQPHALAVLTEDLREKIEHGETSRDAVTQQLSSLVANVNATLDPHERLQFLAVTKEPWAVENGLLTPTMKVKRGAIEETYGPVAESWYESSAEVVWQA
jgi:long-chain acyl-CoA synthetase